MPTDATTASYSVRGSKPGVLLAHTIAKEYTIVGITVKEFMDKHTGMEFNLNELRKIFKTHCNDYMEDLAQDKSSKAVEFCSKVIYEVGPDSRKVKKGTGDKVWKFIFKVGNDDHFVFIATYKQENAEFKPENTHNTMILSLKQAALLVHETLARLVSFGLLLEKTLLTPLAGACFCKEDLGSLSEELDMTKKDLIIAINQSTQGGGQYLSNSDIDIAICASVSATKNVKDENLKKSIVTKIVKQYMAQGRIPDKRRVLKICRYATGGIPADFSFESLTEMINSEQRSYAAIRLKRMEAESAVTGTVDIPIVSAKGPVGKGGAGTSK